MDWDRKRLISVLEKPNLFFLTGLIILVLLIRKWIGLLLWKNHLSSSSKLDWGSYIISIGKTNSKKMGALIHSMKFLSPMVVLYLYKSAIQPSMEMTGLVLLAATWKMLYKLQNEYVGLLVLHLLPLLNPWLIIGM